jgi:hypothetical protein
MKIENQDYEVDVGAQEAVLKGVLRLATPAAYKRIFDPLTEAVTASETYQVDIRDVKFMNSSGITALSRLVLASRKQDKPLVILGASTVAWQKKTITSLKRLHKKLTVELA